MPTRPDRRVTLLRELTRTAVAAYVDAQEVIEPVARKTGREAAGTFEGGDRAQASGADERGDRAQSSGVDECKRQELASASVRS